MVIQLSRFAEIYTLLTQAPVVSDLEDHTHRHFKQPTGFVNQSYRLRKKMAESCCVRILECTFNYLSALNTEVFNYANALTYSKNYDKIYLEYLETSPKRYTGKIICHIHPKKMKP